MLWQAKTQRQLFLEQVKKHVIVALDHRLTVFLVFFMTIWALFVDDMAIAVPLDKSVDAPIGYTTLVFLILFAIEQIARSIVQYEEYFLSFFWWMEFFANGS